MKELTNEQAKMLSLVENIQRDNLTPIEEARAYAINLDFEFPTSINWKTFFDRKIQNGKIKDFADKIGKGETTVRN
ncbi:MAG: hypothetical protein ACFFDF_18975 [Candidatus Odinarchaeota archaeon]